MISIQADTNVSLASSKQCELPNVVIIINSIYYFLKFLNSLARIKINVLNYITCKS